MLFERTRSLRRLACRAAGVAGLAALLLSPLGARSRSDTAVAIGTLTPFYRATQLQGVIVGHGLIDIPAYLTGDDVDIRYRKNPKLNKEVPFADTFSIARFLGGYNERRLKQFGLWNPALGRSSFDYVIRNAAGQLEARPDIIATHLRPYLDAGYSLGDVTINIENVPWAIARDGGDDGLYGQRNPPARIEDWAWTVRHFASDLKAQFGDRGTPSFKIGNEYNTGKSFAGTAADYDALYETAFRELREQFPNSAIAPGEFAGSGRCGRQPGCVYDVAEFVTQAIGTGAAPAYVPRSLHAFQNSGRVMPSETARRAVGSYARLPGVRSEIHQFGLLGQPFGPFAEFGNDQGARQAAWQFQVLMRLEETLRPTRVFHWGGIFHYAGSDVAVLNGTGFLRLMLDRYLGATMYRLPAKTSGLHGEAMAVAFVRPGTTALIVSSFSAGQNDDAGKVTIEVPAAIVQANHVSGWRYTWLSSDDDVFLAIRRDLAASNNLKPEFASCGTCTAEPQRMAADPAKARQTIVANAGKYQDAVKETLRWRPLRDLSQDAADDGKVWHLPIRSNELLIVECLCNPAEAR